MGALIDWYNVQFYNRKFPQSSCLQCHPHLLILVESPVPGYETCDSLINSGSGSAVLEIAASGVDMNKIVIGKPGSPQDVTNGGYVDPAALSTCLTQAKAKGWNAGVMAYQVCSRTMTPAMPNCLLCVRDSSREQMQPGSQRSRVQISHRVSVCLRL